MPIKKIQTSIDNELLDVSKQLEFFKAVLILLRTGNLHFISQLVNCQKHFAKNCEDLLHYIYLEYYINEKHEKDFGLDSMRIIMPHQPEIPRLKKPKKNEEINKIPRKSTNSRKNIRSQNNSIENIQNNSMPNQTQSQNSRSKTEKV